MTVSERKISPCYNCELRHEACHDSCVEFIEWKSKVDSARIAKQEEGRRSLNKPSKYNAKYFGGVGKVKKR